MLQTFKHNQNTKVLTHSHPFQVSLPNPLTLSHKSSFIQRTCDLRNILPLSCCPESYNFFLSIYPVVVAVWALQMIDEPNLSMFSVLRQSDRLAQLQTCPSCDIIFPSLLVFLSFIHLSLYLVRLLSQASLLLLSLVISSLQTISVFQFSQWREDIHRGY